MSERTNTPIESFMKNLIVSKLLITFVEQYTPRGYCLRKLLNRGFFIGRSLTLKIYREVVAVGSSQGS